MIINRILIKNEVTIHYFKPNHKGHKDKFTQSTQVV